MTGVAGPSNSAGGPFAALGLDPDADLTDDAVRVAWRRIAAATHPDRADGGDPALFAAAAAAFTDLRTAFGRGEARADLGSGRPRPVVRLGRPALASPVRWPVRAVAALRNGQVAARMVRGRPVRLVLRILCAAGAAAAGWLAAGPGPAGPALAVGAVTWLVITARRDLGPP